MLLSLLPHTIPDLNPLFWRLVQHDRLQIGSLSVNNGLSWRFHGENGDICTLFPRLECELDDISRI